MSTYNSNPVRPILVKETGKFCYPTPTRGAGTFNTTPNTLSVSSITTSGTTATVTTSSAHGLSSGKYVTISGATQVNYNGIVKVTVTGLTTFTYTVLSGTVTPATGTIIVDKGGCVAAGTGTLAGIDFRENDFIYVPALDAIRRVSKITSETSWEFEQNFPSNVSGAVVNRVANGVYNSIGCRNIGGASGTFNETTILTTDPEIVYYDINSITPVCGNASGTTLLIAAQQRQSN